MIREALVDVWRVAMNPWAIGLPILIFGIVLFAVVGNWVKLAISVMALPVVFWLAWRWHVREFGADASGAGKK